MKCPQQPSLKCPSKPHLAGVAPKEAIGIRTSTGESATPENAIFPLIAFEEGKDAVIIGTGAYVSHNGAFITARHSLMHVYDPPTGPFGEYRQRQRTSIEAIHFLKEGGYVRRPILRFTISNAVDIAVGVAAPMTSDASGAALISNTVSITLRPLVEGETVSTYAYPATVIEPLPGGFKIATWGQFFVGRYLENMGDRLRTDMHIHGGASGGPVFGSCGKVIGVNRSSLGDETNLSFVTPIAAAMALEIHDVRFEGEEDGPSSTTLADLAHRGLIEVSR